MGEYVRALMVKLGRVWVPPHESVTKEGHPYHVKGYWRVDPNVRRTSPSLARRATELMTEAAAQEKVTTPLLTRVAQDAGGEMRGLEFRLKGRPRLIEKMEERGDRISDVLRYTMVLPVENYTQAAKQSLLLLEAAGYEIRSKNWWKPGDAYQGLNVALGMHGQEIELQFHTEESLRIKEEAHLIFQEFRQIPVVKDENGKPAYRTQAEKDRARQLYVQMVRLSDTVQIPPGIEEIPTEKFEPFEDLPALSMEP